MSYKQSQCSWEKNKTKKTYKSNNNDFGASVDGYAVDNHQQPQSPSEDIRGKRELNGGAQHQAPEDRSGWALTANSHCSTSPSHQRGTSDNDDSGSGGGYMAALRHGSYSDTLSSSRSPSGGQHRYGGVGSSTENRRGSMSSLSGNEQKRRGSHEGKNREKIGKKINWQNYSGRMTASVNSCPQRKENNSSGKYFAFALLPSIDGALSAMKNVNYNTWDSSMTTSSAVTAGYLQYAARESLHDISNPSNSRVVLDLTKELNLGFRQPLSTHTSFTRQEITTLRHDIDSLVSDSVLSSDITSYFHSRCEKDVEEPFSTSNGGVATGVSLKPLYDYSSICGKIQHNLSAFTMARYLGYFDKKEDTKEQNEEGVSSLSLTVNDAKGEEVTAEGHSHSTDREKNSEGKDSYIIPPLEIPLQYNHDFIFGFLIRVGIIDQTTELLRLAHSTIMNNNYAAVARTNLLSLPDNTGSTFQTAIETHTLRTPRYYINTTNQDTINRLIHHMYVVCNSMRFLSAYLFILGALRRAGVTKGSLNFEEGEEEDYGEPPAADLSLNNTQGKDAKSKKCNKSKLGKKKSLHRLLQVALGPMARHFTDYNRNGCKFDNQTLFEHLLETDREGGWGRDVTASGRKGTVSRRTPEIPFVPVTMKMGVRQGGFAHVGTDIVYAIASVISTCAKLSNFYYEHYDLSVSVGGQKGNVDAQESNDRKGDCNRRESAKKNRLLMDADEYYPLKFFLAQDENNPSGSNASGMRRTEQYNRLLRRKATILATITRYNSLLLLYCIHFYSSNRARGELTSKRITENDVIWNYFSSLFPLTHATSVINDSIQTEFILADIKMSNHVSVAGLLQANMMNKSHSLEPLSIRLQTCENGNSKDDEFDRLCELLPTVEGIEYFFVKKVQKATLHPILSPFLLDYDYHVRTMALSLMLLYIQCYHQKFIIAVEPQCSLSSTVSMTEANPYINMISGPEQAEKTLVGDILTQGVHVDKKTTALKLVSLSDISWKLAGAYVSTNKSRQLATPVTNLTQYLNMGSSVTSTTSVTSCSLVAEYWFNRSSIMRVAQQCSVGYRSRDNSVLPRLLRRFFEIKKRLGYFGNCEVLTKGSVVSGNGDNKHNGNAIANGSAWGNLHNRNKTLQQLHSQQQQRYGLRTTTFPSNHLLSMKDSGASLFPFLTINLSTNVNASSFTSSSAQLGYAIYGIYEALELALVTNDCNLQELLKYSNAQEFYCKKTQNQEIDNGEDSSQLLMESFMEDLLSEKLPMMIVKQNEEKGRDALLLELRIVKCKLLSNLRLFSAFRSIVYHHLSVIASITMNRAISSTQCPATVERLICFLGNGGRLLCKYTETTPTVCSMSYDGGNETVIESYSDGATEKPYEKVKYSNNLNSAMVSARDFASTATSSECCTSNAHTVLLASLSSPVDLTSTSPSETNPYFAPPERQMAILLLLTLLKMKPLVNRIAGGDATSESAVDCLARSALPVLNLPLSIVAHIAFKLCVDAVKGNIKMITSEVKNNNIPMVAHKKSDIINENININEIDNSIANNDMLGNFVIKTNRRVRITNVVFRSINKNEKEYNHEISYGACGLFLHLLTRTKLGPDANGKVFNEDEYYHHPLIKPLDMKKLSGCPVFERLDVVKILDLMAKSYPWVWKTLLHSYSGKHSFFDVISSTLLRCVGIPIIPSNKRGFPIKDVLLNASSAQNCQHYTAYFVVNSPIDNYNHNLSTNSNKSSDAATSLRMAVELIKALNSYLGSSWKGYVSTLEGYRDVKLEDFMGKWENGNHHYDQNFYPKEIKINADNDSIESSQFAQVSSFTVKDCTTNSTKVALTTGGLGNMIANPLRKIGQPLKFGDFSVLASAMRSTSKSGHHTDSSDDEQNRFIVGHHEKRLPSDNEASGLGFEKKEKEQVKETKEKIKNGSTAEKRGVNTCQATDEEKELVLRNVILPVLFSLKKKIYPPPVLAICIRSLSHINFYKLHKQSLADLTQALIITDLVRYILFNVTSAEEAATFQPFSHRLSNGEIEVVAKDYHAEEPLCIRSEVLSVIANWVSSFTSVVTDECSIALSTDIVCCSSTFLLTSVYDLFPHISSPCRSTNSNATSFHGVMNRSLKSDVDPEDTLYYYIIKLLTSIAFTDSSSPIRNKALMTLLIAINSTLSLNEEEIRTSSGEESFNDKKNENNSTKKNNYFNDGRHTFHFSALHKTVNEILRTVRNFIVETLCKMIERYGDFSVIGDNADRKEPWLLSIGGLNFSSKGLTNTVANSVLCMPSSVGNATGMKPGDRNLGINKDDSLNTIADFTSSCVQNAISTADINETEIVFDVFASPLSSRGGAGFCVNVMLHETPVLANVVPLLLTTLMKMYNFNDNENRTKEGLSYMEVAHGDALPMCSLFRAYDDCNSNDLMSLALNEFGSYFSEILNVFQLYGILPFRFKLDPQIRHFEVLRQNVEMPLPSISNNYGWNGLIVFMLSTVLNVLGGTCVSYLRENMLQQKTNEKQGEEKAYIHVVSSIYCSKYVSAFNKVTLKHIGFRLADLIGDNLLHASLIIPAQKLLKIIEGEIRDAIAVLNAVSSIHFLKTAMLGEPFLLRKLFFLLLAFAVNTKLFSPPSDEQSETGTSLTVIRQQDVIVSNPIRSLKAAATTTSINMIAGLRANIRELRLTFQQMAAIIVSLDIDVVAKINIVEEKDINMNESERDLRDSLDSSYNQDNKEIESFWLKVFMPPEGQEGVLTLSVPTKALMIMNSATEIISNSGGAGITTWQQQQPNIKLSRFVSVIADEEDVAFFNMFIRDFLY